MRMGMDRDNYEESNNNNFFKREVSRIPINK